MRPERRKTTMILRPGKLVENLNAE